MSNNAFRDHIAHDNMTPLWEVLRGLTPREPKQTADPVIWRAETIRQNMKMACEVISAEDAERRVLVLENPKFQGKSQITSSLYAGIQMILPGEVAPSHRHTASALRLILSGQGGFTTVHGEKVLMNPGDFVITPTNVFHDHGAQGTEPVMWLDGLDVPVVQMLNAGFSADDPNLRQVLTRPTGDSNARFAAGLRPVGDTHGGPVSPLFHYPYSRTRAALEQLSLVDEWDACNGFKLMFTNPTNGLSPIRSMGAFMQMFPAGFKGTSFRETDGAVCCVVEGSLRVQVGDQTWTACKDDVFVLPGWAWRCFEADEQCVLFSFSDRPLQEHLGFWRSEINPSATTTPGENHENLSV
ncbi:cupin domain-containing protein [Pseudomonas fluorescens]|uniref:Cupin domain-containing protein n=2 Tax=Gammaproteobacteria TaxID=1236 RepID=A0A1H1I4G8_9PSED|nr:MULTISPECIES: cupin domain-containing protein [Pseudomonas]NKI45871.1 cupin domain-containing protein [Pseudomonas fluorescens]MBX9404400.1 cupin domain-containing protein [Pseudomonas baetica]NKI53403.1 cupin domain-containing protein [Pseudomonas fluorescens]NKI62405.1 cupin domain-containing protein [Pseudomonas fluorescens]TWR65746.1 cupin domain-containing protein [Pseudomonas grimontii]